MQITLRKPKKLTCLSVASAGLFLSGCQSESKNDIKSDESPNIVIIFCDDLGYGDVGCFGATDIKTPNIDKIADQGIQFTEFYSASPVSSPSRAALLTGRYPERMGLNSVFFPESLTGMPTGEITMADKLKEQGYATAIFGKWHLGHMHRYLPLQRGFDDFFGVPYSNDMASYAYMRGNDVEDFHVDQQYLTKRLTEEACQYIEQNSNKPFFMFLSHPMPHVPLYASEDFIGSSERGLYGDVIQELDWSVGEVLDKLEEQGILENTLVIFTSDNGPWLVMEDHGGSAGMLRKGKMFTFEGGVRVPTVAMWPKVIAPGTVYDDMVSMMDLFPTFGEITGYEIPDDRVIDGKPILSVLKGEGVREAQNLLYFYLGDYRCVRKGDWKYKTTYPGNEKTRWRSSLAAHGELLFNLKDDPGEQNNLADSMPDKLQDMRTIFEKEYEKMGNLPPDIVPRTSADHSHFDYLRSK